MGEEEAAGQNATVDIDYEFVKEAKVMVDINTKFFTLFSSGERMRLPLIYLLSSQVKAYRDKLNIDQVRKAYADMTRSLANAIPKTLSDKVLVMELMNSISRDILANPELEE